jgi:hypothetical protein
MNMDGCDGCDGLVDVSRGDEGSTVKFTVIWGNLLPRSTYYLVLRYHSRGTWIVCSVL